MMERVALSAGRCGSECVEYSLIEPHLRNHTHESPYYQLYFQYDKTQ